MSLQDAGLGGVVLAADSNSGDEGSGMSDDDNRDSEGIAAGTNTTAPNSSSRKRTRPGRPQQHAVDDGDDVDDTFDNGEPRDLAAAEAAPDIAHFGMARKSALNTDQRHQRPQQQQGEQRALDIIQKAGTASDKQTQQQQLSLAEQEAMALHLLAARPW